MVEPVPPLEDLLAGLRLLAIPLRVPFRGVTVREAALIEGPRGWGEFAPFVEYASVEAARWLAAAIEAAWTGWPAPRRDQVPVNATVPAVPAEQVESVLARFDGCRTVKVKVAQAGQTLADDVARVAAVRAATVGGEPVRVRLDANGAWDVPAALAAIEALAPYHLEYVEQPCATVPELLALREALAARGLPVSIAADESIRKADDPLRVARLGAADLIVVKVAPLGGVAAALDIVRAAGLPAVVSSALDTSVGIAAGVALAAALPELAYDCGLGTVSLLAADVATVPLVPRAGFLPVCQPTPDPAALTALAADADRTAWWRDRIAACREVLAAGSGG